MNVSLQSVQDLDLTDSERAIFHVLKATLEYPANPQAKSRKLADDIIFFCTSQQEIVNVGEILSDVWSVVIDIASTVPPGHPWQESLVQALEILHRQDGAVLEGDKFDLWKNLPSLARCVREKWSDPTCTGEELNEEFTMWKNLNSFVARITSRDFAPWLNLPIWQLRMALEEPPVKGPAMECRVWVASEWIIYCADLIFQDMNSKEELDESTARSLRMGQLCHDILPLSPERWEYWKKRLSEIAADAVNMGLGDATAEQISNALKCMDALGK